jgi:hypothetical protein
LIYSTENPILIRRKTPMVTPNKMNEKSTFKGIRLEKIVESIFLLKQKNTPSVLYTDFTNDSNNNLVDNSFGIQTSSQKGWYIIQKYNFFTNEVDKSVKRTAKMSR